MFINDQLAIDLGGLHSELTDSVALDDIADEFGIEVGNTYPLDLFHAERRIEASRFRIDTSLRVHELRPDHQFRSDPRALLSAKSGLRRANATIDLDQRHAGAHHEHYDAGLEAECMRWSLGPRRSRLRWRRRQRRK